MSMQSALERGRVAAEARMTATCRITRPGGPLVWNAVTKRNEASVITVYEGKCRVKRRPTMDAVTSVADQVFVESQGELHLPVVGSEGGAAGDSVVMLSCPEDDALVDVKLTVVAWPASSQTTARRVSVRQTQ